MVILVPCDLTTGSRFGCLWFSVGGTKLTFTRASEEARWERNEGKDGHIERVPNHGPEAPPLTLRVSLIKHT